MTEEKTKVRKGQVILFSTGVYDEHQDIYLVEVLKGFDFAKKPEDVYIYEYIKELVEKGHIKPIKYVTAWGRDHTFGHAGSINVQHQKLAKL